MAKLLTNAQVSLTSGTNGSSDGSFLHTDIVFEKLVGNSTPPTIYGDSYEFIDAFSQTVVNYAPISINIADYWNKNPLHNVVIPLDNSEFDSISDDKIITQSGRKAFLINSMLNVQDKLAETFMSHYYYTSLNVKNSHNLRRKMLKKFEDHGIDTDGQNLLFSDVNKLFKEERFLTNKDFNMKKGKVIAMEYATRGAVDAGIEGPLASEGFFFDYITGEVNPSYVPTDPWNPFIPEKLPTPFEYKVEGSILPDVYNAFVKPIAHPLGMRGDYSKICKKGLSDRVFNVSTWRSDGVSVKCTHPSDTSPFRDGLTNPGKPAPDLLLKWTDNPTFDDTLAISDTNPKFILGLPYDAAVQNTEHVDVDESLRGPWDPNTKTYEMMFSTEDGKNLWRDIQKMDENQGNILIDVENGYGIDQYSGMSFTKYVFENGAYLVEYECSLGNGKIERIIEYYRKDSFDASVNYNIVATGAKKPPEAYTTFDGNIVHGKNLLGGVNTHPYLVYALGDENGIGDDTVTGGLDIGGYAQKAFVTIIDYNIVPVVETTLNVLQTKHKEIIEVKAPIPLHPWDLTIDYIEVPMLVDNNNINLWDPVESLVYRNGKLLYNDEWEAITSGSSTVIKVDVIEGDVVEIQEAMSSYKINYIEISSDNTTNIVLGALPTPYTLGPEESVALFKNGRKLVQNGHGADPAAAVYSVDTNASEIIMDPLDVLMTGDKMVIVIMSNYQTLDDYYPYTSTDKYEVINILGNIGSLVEPIIEPTIDVFIDGIKIHDKYDDYGDYDFKVPVNVDSEYTWDQDRNVYNPDKLVTTIYTLGARFIQTKECIVNTYNLRREELTSIQEEFSISTIDYQRNIIHPTYSTSGVLHNNTLPLIDITEPPVNILNKKVTEPSKNGRPAVIEDRNVRNRYQKK